MLNLYRMACTRTTGGNPNQMLVTTPPPVSGQRWCEQLPQLLDQFSALQEHWTRQGQMLLPAGTPPAFIAQFQSYPQTLARLNALLETLHTDLHAEAPATAPTVLDTLSTAYSELVGLYNELRALRDTLAPAASPLMIRLGVWAASTVAAVVAALLVYLSGLGVLASAGTLSAVLAILSWGPFLFNKVLTAYEFKAEWQAQQWQPLKTALRALKALLHDLKGYIVLEQAQAHQTNAFNSQRIRMLETIVGNLVKCVIDMYPEAAASQDIPAGLLMPVDSHNQRFPVIHPIYVEAA